MCKILKKKKWKNLENLRMTLLATTPSCPIPAINQESLKNYFLTYKEIILNIKDYRNSNFNDQIKHACTFLDKLSDPKFCILIDCKNIYLSILLKPLTEENNMLQKILNMTLLRFITIVMGIYKIQFEKEEGIILDEKSIILSNHSSSLDAIILKLL